jgi:hypothetical protein
MRWWSNVPEGEQLNLVEATKQVLPELDEI